MENLEKLSIIQLLEENEKALNEDRDVDFSELQEELFRRNPLNFIEERFVELEKTIAELKEEKEEFKKIIKTHVHISPSGKALIEIS